MQAKEQKRENKIFQILAWALLGAVLTYIVCALSITENHSFNGSLYNCGEVAEINISQFRREINQDQGHQDASGTVTLDQGMFRYTIEIAKYSDAWQYLCVRIGNLTAKSLEWQVTYENLKDGEVIENVTEKYDLSEGKNIFSLPNQSFNRMQIAVSGDVGSTFCVKSMQFRENPLVSRTARGIVVGVVTALCYLILSVVLLYFYRRWRRKINLRPYVCIELLQELYLSVIRRVKVLQSKLPVHVEQRRLLRTILFLFMLCYNLHVNMAESYFRFFKYHILVYVLIFLAIAVLSIEENTSPKNWNNPLVWGWLLTGVLMCISDFIVQKESRTFSFAGYAIILVIGFFIFVWNNMEDRGEIIRDFTRAVHAFLWIVTAYCILFRPHDGSVRYAGFANNVNTFGLCLAALWAFVLGSLEHEFRTRKRKRILLLYVIEACVVLSFVWKTQTVTAWLSIGVVTIIWFAQMCVYAFRHNNIRKIFIQVILCAIILFIPVFSVVSLGLRYVPEKLGTAVVCEDKESIPYEEHIFFGVEAYAGDFTNQLRDNRLIQKLTRGSVTGLLSGRNYVYKEYLRNLNLFGHESTPYIFGTGQSMYAHNGVLGAAYYYGIFTVIPNIIMLIAVIMRTWKLKNEKIKFAAVPFLVCLSYIIMSMADNVDPPFHRFAWFGMYILMGSVFCDVDQVKPVPRKRETNY